MNRRAFLASSAGLALFPLPILSNGHARYPGLHLARNDIARRAVIQEMVSTDKPLHLDVRGTYEIDRSIDLSRYRARTLELHPNCHLKSNGANVAANVFYSRGGKGICIRGGILTPGSRVVRLLHGHAIYFADASDCWVEETVVQGAVRGAIVSNGAKRCGWCVPVCRHSLQYADPPSDLGHIPINGIPIWAKV